MRSIYEVFDDPSMKDTNLLALFRCSRDKEDSYERNREWLSRGWTAWWNIRRKPDGMVVLIDAEGGSGVEVWIAPGAKQIEQWGTKWKLESRTPFSHVDTVAAVTKALIGKNISQGVTYVERADHLDDFEDDLPIGASIVERRQYRLHLRFERNPRASALAKREHGKRCKACGLRFDEMYGDLGRDFIEAHHLRPLATLRTGEVRRYSVKNDFAVLCANCHRMIHRTRDPSNLRAFVAGLRRGARRRMPR